LSTEHVPLMATHGCSRNLSRPSWLQITRIVVRDDVQHDIVLVFFVVGPTLGIS